MSRLETLKKLESTLESFISRAVSAEASRLDTARSLDTLDEIARESLRGRYINNRLARWMSESRKFLDNGRFNGDILSRIGSLFADIQSGLDMADPESRKLHGEIEGWKMAGAVPKRKLVLKAPATAPSSDLLDLYLQYLKNEYEYVANEKERQGHILTILDDVLKSAEAKIDPMYIHLAGSLIYFMKNRGYKVTPFVKRLKDIERLKLGREDDA